MNTQQLKTLDPVTAHQQAEQLREDDQQLAALKAVEEAIIGYQQQGNYSKLAEALLSRFLAYKHLYQQTADKAYAHLAQSDAQTSLKIAQEHQAQDQFARCHFYVGESALLLDNPQQAEQEMRQAYQTADTDNLERSYFQYHWGSSLVELGRTQEGIEQIKQALANLEAQPEQPSKFTNSAWRVGALMELARIYIKQGVKERAQEMIDQADQIIKQQPELKVRQKQLTALKSKLS